QRRIDAFRIVLLGLGEELLIHGGEVEKLVLADSAADRASELLLREAAQARAVGKARSQAGPLLILVQGAVYFVSAGFRHHVDEASGAAAELRGRAVRYHLEFLDGVEADGECGPLTAALFAEERIVIV